MKYIGPAILLIVVTLCYSIIYRPDWVWTLGTIAVLSVFAGIIVTMIADVRARNAQSK